MKERQRMQKEGSTLEEPDTDGAADEDEDDLFGDAMDIS
jgi:hypothetical protein